jgi:arsenate reductase
LVGWSQDEEDDGEEEGFVIVYPRLGAFPDGRGALEAPRRDRFEVMSAGTEATLVRPEATAAMAELGVDISGQESKTLERYLDEPFDYVVTVCDAANEAYLVFPGAKSRLHWSFRDPSRATGDEEERLAVFRAVREEIRERIEEEFVVAE